VSKPNELVYDPTKSMEENITALKAVAKELGDRLISLNQEVPATGDETYWFPGTVSPVHAGLYQRLIEVNGQKVVLWAWWDNGWHVSDLSRERAEKRKNSFKSLAGNRFAWRGCKTPGGPK